MYTILIVDDEKIERNGIKFLLKKQAEPFEIYEEDFRKTAMDYIMFTKNIDAKSFGEKLLNKTMYASKVETDDNKVTISIEKDRTNNGKD